jgi:hypothetical protein
MLASPRICFRSGLLSSVYYGQTGVRTLKELARSYLTVTKDLSPVMNRLKAVYRSWAIPCAGKLVYTPRHRAEWLQKLPEAGIHRRAECLYQQLDMLRCLRHDARQQLLAKSRKHPAARLLCQISCIGPTAQTISAAASSTVLADTTTEKSKGQDSSKTTPCGAVSSPRTTSQPI